MAKKKTQNKNPFFKPDNVTREYERSLRKIAREVGRIIEGYTLSHLPAVLSLQETLEKYSQILTPWAEKKAEEVINAIDLQDWRAWKKASEDMGHGVKLALRRNTFVGKAYAELMAEQVRLIKSIPTEAGNRVHKLVTEGLQSSQRASVIVKELLRTTQVTESRARLIARTETTRAATAFTQARSESIGSDEYIWRTVKDSDVRESHRKMEGKVVKWSNPPTLDGLTGHAGALPNCRCRPEPIIPAHLK